MSSQYRQSDDDCGANGAHSEEKSECISEQCSINKVYSHSNHETLHRELQTQMSMRADSDMRKPSGRREETREYGLMVNMMSEMRENFEGRQQVSSGKRFFWKQNFKWHFFGVCLALLSLTATIVLSEGEPFTNVQFRWAGLVSGSALSVICSAIVVVVYTTKKSYHRHPNPMLFFRAIWDLGLAICLLFNPMVAPSSSDTHAKCKWLSGATEFFLAGGDAWGLMIAVDLYLAFGSPFSNYKKKMRFYHLWVWIISLTFAGFLVSTPKAHGFFRMNALHIHHYTKSIDLDGFCLAASTFCCVDQNWNATTQTCKFEQSGTNAKIEVIGKLCPNEGSTYSMTSEKYPWIFFIGPILVVVVVSIAVLVLASLELYVRGLSLRYKAKIGVMNYVALTTTTHVIYWLVFFGLYFLTTYISIRISLTTDDNAENTSIPAHELRQLCAWILCGKGYLNYLLWFAVNPAPGTGNEQYLSEPSDEDLAPQLNVALRNEILFMTTTGIRQSILQQESHTRNQAKQTITLHNSRTGCFKKGTKFSSFAPNTFSCIRGFFSITDEEYMNMFQATTKEQISEGASDAFMFYTANERLIVKTMSLEECHLLRKMAPKYATYLMANPKSLLTKFLGCHSIELFGRTYYFVVMENIFYNSEDIHQRFDIKGSWEDRNCKQPRLGGVVNCRFCNATYTYGSKRHQECVDGMRFHEPNIVLKDNDMLSKIHVNYDDAKILRAQIRADSDFLCSQGVMDYSLLVGVHVAAYFVEDPTVQAESKTYLGPADFMPGLYDERIPSNSFDPYSEISNACKKQKGHSTSDRLSTSFRSHLATTVDGPAVYQIGIIDFLQQWTMQKKLERFYKSTILRRDPNGVSAVPPERYKRRFQKKVGSLLTVKRTTPSINSHRQESQSRYRVPHSYKGQSCKSPELQHRVPSHTSATHRKRETSTSRSRRQISHMRENNNRPSKKPSKPERRRERDEDYQDMRDFRPVYMEYSQQETRLGRVQSVGSLSHFTSIEDQ